MTDAPPCAAIAGLPCDGNGCGGHPCSFWKRSVEVDDRRTLAITRAGTRITVTIDCEDEYQAIEFYDQMQAMIQETGDAVIHLTGLIKLRSR